MGADGFQVVARFPDTVQAEAARVLLEDSGIPAFVRGGHSVSMDPVILLLDGGISVEVHASNLDGARDLLKNSLAGAAVDEMTAGVGEGVCCPACGQRAGIRLPMGWKQILFSLLLLGLPMLFSHTRYRCSVCGRHFRPTLDMAEEEPLSPELEAAIAEYDGELEGEGGPEWKGP